MQSASVPFSHERILEDWVKTVCQPSSSPRLNGTLTTLYTVSLTNHRLCLVSCLKNELEGCLHAPLWITAPAIHNSSPSQCAGQVTAGSRVLPSYVSALRPKVSWRTERISKTSWRARKYLADFTELCEKSRCVQHGQIGFRRKTVFSM